MRRSVVVALAAALGVACGQSRPPGGALAPPNPRMDRVLSGLRPATAAPGATPIRWTLAERMRQYHVPGVSIAIIDSGRIAWAKGFGVKQAGTTDTVTTSTLFEAGSISKPTFALAVMRLVQAGKLRLDEDVNAKLVSWHVPANRFTTHEKVTLRRILSHSAGLTVHGFPGYEAGAPVPTVPQILDGLKPANTPPVRVDTIPGSVFRYSGGGTTIAMLLVTDVVEMPLPQFMQASVLTPGGMIHSTYEQPLPEAQRSDAATGHDKQGRPINGHYHTYPEMSAAGLWTTPSDLASLAMTLQRTYAGESANIIDQATLRTMFTVQKPPYGLGYVITGRDSTLEFSHGGDDAGFVAMFVAFATRDQGAVIMTNGDDGGDLIDELLTSIAAEYGWPDHQQVVRTSDRARATP